MPCAEFENALLGYADLDAASRAAADRHLSHCGECRSFLESLEEADAAVAASVAGVRLSGSFRAAVLARIEPRPSLIPELLDFFGWAAVLAAGVGLMWVFLPPLTLL